MSAAEIQKCIHDLSIEDQYGLVNWVNSELAPEVELALFDKRLAAGEYDGLIRRARGEAEAGAASTELR